MSETPHPIDHRPIGIVSAHKRIRKELEDNLAYARLYHRLCKKARNTEGIQQWEEQIDQLVLMLAELDKEERAARAGVVHLVEHPTLGPKAG